MDIEVGSLIDLPDLQLTVVQRLESEDRRARYRVETNQRDQYLLQVYSEENWNEFEHEHLCLSCLSSHENILSLSRAAVVPGPPKTGLLLYDCMPIGTLSHLSAQVQDLAEQQVLNYAKEIAKGLAFIHSKGVTHGNLRLENVWVGSDFRCKVAGLEYALCPSSTSRPSNPHRNPFLEAPEQTQAARPSNDIWAFGCLIYQLLYREVPFSELQLKPGQMIAEWKLQSKLVAADWEYLFSRVFMVDPNGRAGARELIDTLGSFKLEKRAPVVLVPPEPMNPVPKRKSSWIGNSTKSWVTSATNDERRPPDSECLRKLVSKAWNKPQKIPKFFSSYQKLNLTRTITVIKSLLVLHCYILQGPSSLVTTHSEAVRKILDRCEVLWAPNCRVRPDECYTEYLAGLVRQFVKLIQRKVELHGAARSMGNWQNSDFSAPALCSQALSYWSDCLLLASRLFIGGRDLVDLRLSWMVQVLEDVLGLYTSLCHSFPAVLDSLEDLSMRAVLILKFQSNYAKMANLGKALQRQRPGVKMVEFPDAHPAEIQRLMTAVPSKLESVDAFLNDNEFPSTDQWRSSTMQFMTLKAVSLEESVRARAATEGTSADRHRSPAKRGAPPLTTIPERPSEPESPNGLDQRLTTLLEGSPSWLLLMDELQFKEVLSMGIYFTVYRGIYRHTAVTISVLRSFIQKPSFASMVEFISLMSCVTHPNLVLFMGASVGRQIVIVTELCEGGSLYELLHDRKDWELPVEFAFSMLTGVARAMHALHSHAPPMPHGELTSAKVLLAEEVTPQTRRITAKLSDFGIRLILDPSGGASQLGYWTAPEVADGGVVTAESDVFSFGVLALEVLRRRVPTEAEIQSKEVPAMLPANVSTLLIHCLDTNADRRPTSQMVLDVFESVAL